MAMLVNGKQPIAYQYDFASRLTQVTQGIHSVGIGYDALGRRTSLTYPNGTSTSYTFDAASRLLNIHHQGAGGATIENLSYTYDASGDRLTSTRVNDSSTLLPNEIQATYGLANQQITFNGIPLIYDQNGNLISDGTNSYVWDARNRLVSANGPNVSANFQYDPMGRRIRKVISGVATEFVYDGKNIVAEISGSTETASYLRSLDIDEPFVRISNSNEYFHANALGSTLQLTTDTETTKATYSYEQFGSTIISGNSANSFMFAGRENDATGLYYNRARYYSPRLGRFISEDPILSPYTPFSIGACQKTNRTIWTLPSTIQVPGANISQKLNHYVYSLNNPVRLRDPLGLDAECDLAAIVRGCEDIMNNSDSAHNTGRQTLVECATGEYEMYPSTSGLGSKGDDQNKRELFGIGSGTTKTRLRNDLMRIGRDCIEKPATGTERNAFGLCQKAILDCIETLDLPE